MTALQIVRGHPYLTFKQVSEETGKCIRVVQKRVKGIREQIELGRYSPYVLPEGEQLVNWYAYIDFLTYRKRLEDKNLRKTVPAFDPAEIERLSGFKTRVIDLGED